MSSEYPFVVVTHPAQLKDEGTRRVIRKTVMHDYMRKESRNASSTDPRILRRRLRTTTHVRDEPDEAQCTEESSPPELSGPSSTASRSSSDSSRPAMGHSLGHNETVINPLIMPEPIQDELASLVNGIRHFSISSDAVASKTYLDPLWERIRLEKHDHFVSALVYQHEDITRLINRDHNAVSPVNLDLLKAVCGAYYSSTACNRQWTHLLLESPEAYLSALCLVAPFTDLMIMGEVWNGDDPSKYLRQTLEVLDVVPRMINDRIKAPDKSHDDHTAIAIAQLLSCQLATPHHSHLDAHRQALKDIVGHRGGLHRLGGDGVVARFLTITELEAAIFTDISADHIYYAWANLYYPASEIPKDLPESPLLKIGQGQASHLSEDELCVAVTPRIIFLIQDLTDLVCEAKKQDSNLHDQGGIRPEWSANDDVSFMASVRHKLHLLHQFPKHTSHADLTDAGWVYETVRLAALRYCHAIESRQPLYEDVRCAYSTSSGECCEPALPRHIYDAIRRSPLKTIWNRLVGVLHWGLLVAAASCPPTSRHRHILGDGEPRVDDDRPSERQNNKRHAGPVREAQLETLPDDSGVPQEVMELFNEYFNNPDKGSDPSDILMTSSLHENTFDSPCQYMTLQREPTNRTDQQSSARRKRRFSEETQDYLNTSTGLGKEIDEMEVSEASDKETAHIRQFFTSHAIRVSILLRFEHPHVVVHGLRRMADVMSWLRRD